MWVDGTNGETCGFFMDEKNHVAMLDDEGNDWPAGVYTANGIEIVPGMRVLDYNREETTVTNRKPFMEGREWQNGQPVPGTGRPWFTTANGGLFDGSRLRALEFRADISDANTVITYGGDLIETILAPVLNTLANDEYGPWCVEVVYSDSDGLIHKVVGNLIYSDGYTVTIQTLTEGFWGDPVAKFDVPMANILHLNVP